MNINFSENCSLYVIENDYSSVTNWGWHFAKNSANTVVRFARGKKSKNVKSLFDEFSASLQFPYYFGENWNAFSDCITDLDWLECEICVVVVFDAEQILIGESLEIFDLFIKILEDANEERAISFQSIDLSQQTRLKTYIVLQCSEQAKPILIKKLQSVSANFKSLHQQ